MLNFDKFTHAEKSVCCLNLVYLTTTHGSASQSIGLVLRSIPWAHLSSKNRTNNLFLFQKEEEEAFHFPLFSLTCTWCCFRTYKPLTFLYYYSYNCFLKCFFIYKYIKIIYIFYFFKIIFNINISKSSKKYQKIY